MRWLLFACALTACACRVHRSELDETLEWMDNTYNPHNDISGADGHGRAAWYTHAEIVGAADVMVWGESETFTYKGCDLTLRTEDDRRASTAKEIYNDVVDHFNLRDIDPSSIKIETASHFGGFPCEARAPEELVP